MKSTVLVISLFLSSITYVRSQEVTLPQFIIELKLLREASFEAGDAQARNESNKRFTNKLKGILGAGQKVYQFADSIPRFGAVKSPDGKFVLYNWNSFDERGEFTYYAFIVLKDGQILEPLDDSPNTYDPLVKKLPVNKWYGALYYEIIPVKGKKKQNYYVLLGWDGKSNFGTRKVIDVFYFDNELNNWYFGKNIFEGEYSKQTRFFLEYSSKVVVSLKYEPKLKRIIFDDLVPQNANLEGVFDYYVPSMQFNAFVLKKDKWYFVRDVDARGDQGMEMYNDPRDQEAPPR